MVWTMRRQRPTPDKFYVVLRVGKPLFWEVSADKILEVPNIPEGSHCVLSFDEFDRRLATTRPLSGQQAKRALLREYGDRTRVVNESRRLAVIYGRSADRVAEASFEMTPGTLCLDRLMARTQVAPQPRITGFAFGVQDGVGRQLALLFALDANGNIAAFQEAINPQNLEYVIEELARANGIDLQQSETLLFTQDDVLAVTAELKPYPRTEDWNGIRLRSLHVASFALLATAFAASVVLDSYYILAAANLGASTSRLRSQAGRLSDENENTIKRNMVFFCQALSLPYARVSLRASSRADEFTVRVDTEGESVRSSVNGRTGNRARPYESVRAILDAPAPFEFVLTDVSASGEFNSFYVKYTHAKGVTALADLAGR
jgi:hypothetical protein